MQTTILENLERLEDQISGACKRAGRPRGDVQLMAVSKLHPADALREAAAAGVMLFGENRVQEWGQKLPLVADLSIKVHLVGHLQSNKVTKAAEIFAGVDTVDSVRLAEKLDESAGKLSRTVPVLIEVKLSPEEAKTGIGPRDLPHLLERFVDFRNLQLRGLMTVPPWSEDPEAARPYFSELRKLRDRLTAAYPALDISELSMGMSGDFAVAVEEGSTCIRIGTAIFGKRRSSSQVG